MLLRLVFLMLACVLSVDCARERGKKVMKCDVARMKCAFRRGCGMALHNYVIECSDVITGRTKRCSDLCQKSLIALTSTNEGQVLMNCECGEDEFCVTSKRRAEVCRDVVTEAIDDRTVVSCSVAQWICAADSECGMALEYYHHLCRAMFHGHKCSDRCNNSRSILDRQEKAAKLKTCYCDGTEPYDCVKIRQNMDRLCFGRTELIDYHWRGGNSIDSNGRRSDASNDINPASAAPSYTNSTHRDLIMFLLASLALYLTRFEMNSG